MHTHFPPRRFFVHPLRKADYMVMCYETVISHCWRFQDGSQLGLEQVIPQHHRLLAEIMTKLVFVVVGVVLFHQTTGKVVFHEIAI